MRTLIAMVVVSLAVSLSPAASAVVPAGTDDWHGSRHVMPSSYDWLNEYTPDYDYDLVIVRGLAPAGVRRTLGTTTRRLPDMAPGRAEGWTFHHSYETPPIVVVDRRGLAVWVYLPAWFLGEDEIAALSRKGLAAHFTTTIELDTYVTIAKRGEVVRDFNAYFQPPPHGALPEEEGLDWGSRHQNVWATAWAFLERVSRIHVSRDWFNDKHPTYQFDPRVVI
jgi:hypothetical protein